MMIFYDFLYAIVDGEWSSWTNFGTCSTTCGSGQQRQRRTCIGQSNGGKPCPSTDPTEKLVSCDLMRCPGIYLTMLSALIILKFLQQNL